MSFLTTERAEAQQAFVGLLAYPLVAPWNQPHIHSLVRRHSHLLTTWATRLGYQLVNIDQAYRLRRVPIDGRVAAPAGELPPRVQLLYALYVAVCLEQHRDDTISLQEISDVLAQFAGIGNRRPYHAKIRAHRRQLVAAVELLSQHGVLERLTRHAMQEDWERSGEGVGAGFVLHRDALMLLVDTTDVDLALAHRAASADSRRAVILRGLVEQQSLHPWELDDDTRTYLANQRSRLIRDTEEMTGGTVEIRADAWLLILPADRQTADSALVAFPDTTTLDWACLAFIDALSPHGAAPFTVTGNELQAIAATLHTERSQHLTAALRESPSILLQKVTERLIASGLIRSVDAGWTVLPAAGRYRDAELKLARVAETALFEESP